MKRVRNCLAMMLAMVMLLACFAGCAPADKPTTPSNGGNTKTELKVAGAKIKAVCYEAASKDNEAVIKAINDKLGFEIEWIVCPASEGWAATDRLLAADSSIDMLYLGMARMRDYLSKGYLMDVSSYVGDARFPNVQKWNVPLMEGTAASDGKYYGFPLVAPGSYATTNGMAVALREDWLKEANLQEPKTIDDLDKILAAFKAKDPTKYPLMEDGADLGGVTANLFARSFSPAGQGWWIDKDGTMKHWIQHPDFRKFVEKKKEWYDKGYLHPEFVTADVTQLMSANEVGVVAAWCTNAINPNVALMEQDPNARFMMLKGTLEGPAGKGLLGGTPAGAYLGINAGSKNPDACVAALDFFQTEEGSRLATWGIEGTNYKLDGENVAREAGDHVYNNQMNPYTCQPQIMGFKTGQHYTDTQYCNWYSIFYSPQRYEQLFYEPDCGYLYDYSTGDNQYPTLNTTANTYISEMIVNMVTGVESIDQWDAKIKELEGIALNQMVKERNEQWAKYDKAVFKQGKPFLDLSTKKAWMDDYKW